MAHCIHYNSHELDAFRRSWPCHGLPDNLAVITFVYASSGDLVDIDCRDENDKYLDSATVRRSSHSHKERNETMSAGIDYGRSAQTNRNVETGFHCGVIAIHAITQAWSDSSESDYGEATCPKCEGRAVSLGPAHADLDLDYFGQYEDQGCADYVCEECKLTIDSTDCFPEEARGWNCTDSAYDASTCFDGACVMVTRAPYFTKARFCSPCAPGAGDLDNPDDDGAETYCFGHDWFDDGKAPYPVYSVETRELVQPAKG